MNGEESPAREIEALVDLKKIENIANHQIKLLAAFKNDSVELLQFLLFLMANNLLPKAERFLLLVVYIRLTETYGLNCFLKLLWEVEREAKEGVILFHDLIVHKSYGKVN